MTSNPRKAVLWTVVLIVVVIGIYVAFQPNPVPVDTATISKGSLEVSVGDEGRTRIREIYEVSAPVTGRVLRIEGAAGDQVKKGETALVVIQPSDPTFLDRRNRAQAESAVKASEAALKFAEADLARAKAEFDFTFTELKRAQKLAARKNLSAQGLDRASLDFKKAGAAMATAQATLDMRRYELESSKAALMDPIASAKEKDQKTVTVYAPIDGQVLRLLRESEAIVQAGTPLMELGNPNDLEVVVDLLSSDAVKVRAGAPVRIVDWGGEGEITGKVRLIEPYGFSKISALGIEEQRVNVVIDLLTKDLRKLGLGHGFRVNTKILVWQNDSVLRAPLSGLFRHANEWSTFVVHEGQAMLKKVKLGRRNANFAEITEGLKEGDQIVLYPGDRVDDGISVQQRSD
ncbi:MAG: HlyD family efflux transporter periplasmic adaptor subunit [Alphaproteobacteria bacterium]|nr:HlyD family efflux transporter periplasmic adaptor subunit [Rhodospirillales bacterium]MCW9045761.1 HlyD family efflux transporter periplasmic adaptor subunit [Alphaproteobacteria bacterium]